MNYVMYTIPFINRNLSLGGIHTFGYIQLKIEPKM